MNPEQEAQAKTNSAKMSRQILNAALTHRAAIHGALNMLEPNEALAAITPFALATAAHVAEWMENAVQRPQAYEANPDPAHPDAPRRTYNIQRAWMLALGFPGSDVGLVDITGHVRDYQAGNVRLSPRSMEQIAEMPLDRLCCPLLGIQEEGGVRIIDGNHRALRSWKEGIHLVPIVVLPAIAEVGILMSEFEAFEYAREALRTNASVREDEIDKVRRACNISREIAVRLIEVASEPPSEAAREQFISILTEAGLTVEQFAEATERA
jgi:hypothetical protein